MPIAAHDMHLSTPEQEDDRPAGALLHAPELAVPLLP
jgi:hypothetical protein